MFREALLEFLLLLILHILISPHFISWHSLETHNLEGKRNYRPPQKTSGTCNTTGMQEQNKNKSNPWCKWSWFMYQGMSPGLAMKQNGFESMPAQCSRVSQYWTQQKKSNFFSVAAASNWAPASCCCCAVVTGSNIPCLCCRLPLTLRGVMQDFKLEHKITCILHPALQVY